MTTLQQMQIDTPGTVKSLVRAIVVFPLELIFLGGIAAGFVWGAYLTICCLIGLHCDQAFASMGIPDFKNFLRLKIEPNKLTIFPIGLRRTPRRWSWRRAKQRGGDGLSEGPAIVPLRPLRPILIEGPIEIRVGDVKRPTARARRGSVELEGVMQTRLSRPASELKAHYDVVVVGSGYGGGVAAARLARCGKRVAVLERGREFLPGDFPDRVTAAAKELQVSGAHMRMGSATALFDVRLGDDVNVMMACGLGGTSLINANVCLSPDARVFDDRAWPPQVRRDRLLAEGFVRARHMLRPEPCADWSRLRKCARCGSLRRPWGAVSSPCLCTSPARPQRRRRLPGGLHAVRRLLRRMQRRRQDHGRLDLSRGR